jgi:hypothetical protein
VTENSSAITRPKPSSEPVPAPDRSSQCIGTPAAPALKPRPIGFAVSLVLFAIWIAILIYWSIHLHRPA